MIQPKYWSLNSFWALWLLLVAVIMAKRICILYILTDLRFIWTLRSLPFVSTLSSHLYSRNWVEIMRAGLNPAHVHGEIALFWHVADDEWRWILACQTLVPATTTRYTSYCLQLRGWNLWKELNHGNFTYKFVRFFFADEKNCFYIEFFFLFSLLVSGELDKARMAFMTTFGENTCCSQRLKSCLLDDIPVYPQEGAVWTTSHLLLASRKRLGIQENDTLCQSSRAGLPYSGRPWLVRKPNSRKLRRFGSRRMASHQQKELRGLLHIHSYERAEVGTEKKNRGILPNTSPKASIEEILMGLTNSWQLAARQAGWLKRIFASYSLLNLINSGRADKTIFCALLVS
jgi:hypothetical protein